MTDEEKRTQFQGYMQGWNHGSHGFTMNDSKGDAYKLGFKDGNDARNKAAETQQARLGVTPGDLMNWVLKAKRERRAAAK